MAGVRKGCERSPLRRSISRCGTRYHRKFNFQLNPPHVLQSNGQSERSQRGPPAEAVANEGKRGQLCRHLHVRGGDVLERLIRNDVDDGADHGLAIVDDFGEEGLQPSLRALAVRVKEGEHAALGVLGAQQPGTNRTSK